MMKNLPERKEGPLANMSSVSPSLDKINGNITPYHDLVLKMFEERVLFLLIISYTSFQSEVV